MRECEKQLWFLAWLMVSAISYGFIFLVLTVNDPIFTFFSWIYLVFFVCGMMFILREIINANWRNSTVWILIFFFLLTFITIDRLAIDHNSHRPAQTNNLCDGEEKMGYCI